MYKYQYVCTSLKYNTWYEFRGHRWIEIDSGGHLKSRISNEVLNEYLQMNSQMMTKSMSVTDAGKEPFINNAKKLLDVTLKLQDITFKEKLMKECSLLFHDEKFMEKLDMKWNLLGFENGVYDLEKGELRDGRPEDYISLTTGIDYMEYEIDADEILEVQEFMSKVYPVPRVREYVYKLLASFLQGKNPDEKFHIWTGSGSTFGPQQAACYLATGVQLTCVTA
jgi:phage/plasmid-associated DNA primase